MKKNESKIKKKLIYHFIDENCKLKNEKNNKKIEINEKKSENIEDINKREQIIPENNDFNFFIDYSFLIFGNLVVKNKDLILQENLVIEKFDDDGYSVFKKTNNSFINNFELKEEEKKNEFVFFGDMLNLTLNENEFFF